MFFNRIIHSATQPCDFLTAFTKAWLKTHAPSRSLGEGRTPYLVRCFITDYSECPAFGTIARSAFTIIGAWGRSFRTSYAIRLRHYYGFCRNALARGVHGGMVYPVGLEPTDELLLRQVRLPIPPQVHKRHGREGSPPPRTRAVFFPRSAAMSSDASQFLGRFNSISRRCSP